MDSIEELSALGDAVLAAADLVDRAGATGFDIGYAGDTGGIPEVWHAQAFYRRARLFIDLQPSAEAAATGLSVRLLTGAACKCGQKVSLQRLTPGCRWELEGQRWVPGCDAPSIELDAGSRGDEATLRAAVNERAAEQKRAS